MEKMLTDRGAPSTVPGTYLVTHELLLLDSSSLLFVFLSGLSYKDLVQNGKTVMISVEFQLQNTDTKC